MEEKDKEKLEEKVKDIKEERRPWRPSGLTDIPKRFLDSNYVYRFCSATDVNMQKKQSERWEVDKDVLPKMIKAGYNYVPTLNDGRGVDGTLKIRELILMRMRKDDAEERAKYFRNLDNARLKALEGKVKTEDKEFRKRSYVKHAEINERE